MEFCSKIITVTGNSTYFNPIPVQSTPVKSLTDLVSQQAEKVPSLTSEAAPIKAPILHVQIPVKPPITENRLVHVPQREVGFTNYNFDHAASHALVPVISKNQPQRIRLPEPNLYMQERMISEVFNKQSSFLPTFDNSVNALVPVIQPRDFHLPEPNLYMQERMISEVFNKQSSFPFTVKTSESALVSINDKPWQPQRFFTLSTLEIISITICVCAALDALRNYRKKKE